MRLLLFIKLPLNWHSSVCILIFVPWSNHLFVPIIPDSRVFICLYLLFQSHKYLFVGTFYSSFESMYLFVFTTPLSRVFICLYLLLQSQDKAYIIVCSYYRKCYSNCLQSLALIVTRPCIVACSNNCIWQCAVGCSYYYCIYKRNSLGIFKCNKGLKT